MTDKMWDSAVPADKPKQPADPNEPIPSYSNQVGIGEFSVGHYKEYQLREELSNLIYKYNKRYYGDAQKPKIPSPARNEEKVTRKSRYENTAILNPIALPDPS